MKKLKFILTSLFLAALVFQSCEDLEEVDAPTFNVTPATLKVKAGEPLEFKVDNAPNFLNFYSGEFGHEYKYKSRTEIEGVISMSFNSAQKWGVGTSAAKKISVLISSDYDGSGTPESVAKATWNDISDKLTIPTAYDFTWVNSGILDISEYNTGVPVYFAFRYLYDGKNSEGNRQPEWRVADFNVEIAVKGETYSLKMADMNSPGWSPVNVAGENSHSSYDNWNVKGSYYRMLGQRAEYVNDDYLITNPINLSSVQPDKGEALKSYSAPLKSFTHTYNTPGTYTATLVGNNTTIYGNKEAVKEFTITVE